MSGGADHSAEKKWMAKMQTHLQRGGQLSPGSGEPLGVRLQLFSKHCFFCSQALDVGCRLVILQNRVPAT